MDLQIQSNKFDGIRGKIFRLLETIISNNEYFHTSSDGLYRYYIDSIEDKTIVDSLCLVGIIKLDNGILIETSYPKQTNIHNRVWMIDDYLGRFTYLETSNPNLRSHKGITDIYPEYQNMELHAMPEDLQLLHSILQFVSINMHYVPLESLILDSFTSELFIN